MKRRKKKTNIKLDRKREDRMIKNLHEDTMHMYELLDELDGEQEIIDDLAEGIGHLEDLCEALIDQAELPKRLVPPYKSKNLN